MVEDLKVDIYKTLNESGLPMSIIQLVVKDINRDVTEQHTKHIQQLRMQEQMTQEQPAEVVEQTEAKEIE